MPKDNLLPAPDRALVTIPANYVADFRAAVVHEILWEAECIKGHTPKPCADPELKITDPEPTIEYADVRSDAQLMAIDVALFDQLEGVDVLGGENAVLTVEGRGAIESVPNVFEAMAREVVAPRLLRALGVGPMDEDWAPAVHELLARAGWAVELAAQWHAKSAALREAEQAATEED